MANISYIKITRERSRRDFLSATPERAAKTGEPYTEVISLDERGHTIETQRLADWPLERLYTKGSLGPIAVDRDNEAAQRREAGERLYAHWFHGRLFPLGSRDYRKPYSGRADTFSIMPQTMRQAIHRQKWREADACLGGDRTATVTRAIVIEEREPVDVGIAISGRTDKAQARAVAIEWLIDGLDRLRQLWELK